MKSSRILAIDDDHLFLQMVFDQLSLLGFDVTTADNGTEGDIKARSEEYSLVLLDLNLPDTDGITLLEAWRESKLQVPVIIISGEGTIPKAVKALKLGAEDFLVKPVDINLLEAVVKRTIAALDLQVENRRLRQLTKLEDVEFLGISQAVKELLAASDKIAGSDHPVLLEGETGTGKQVLARYIYSRSNRSGEPFVAVNCAAITETLFESELFGHEKGAFTGAHSRKAGKLELVGKGTLFLDEIGELPAACQAKLLTAVEDRVFERVGGNATLHFEGRIIAATNRNLEHEVSTGNFRKDMFYRLNTFRLILPPLRQRPEDIYVYIERTLDRCCREYNRRYELPDDEILEQLSKHPWIGNVRELAHHVERIALFAEGSIIPRQLWLSMPTLRDDLSPDEAIDLKTATEAFKRKHIHKILSSCDGNQTEAAKRLGIERTYLNRLLSSYKQET